jgi:hypothetical protein
MNAPNIYLPYRFYGFDQEVLKKKLLSELSNYNVTRSARATFRRERKEENGLNFWS